MAPSSPASPVASSLWTPRPRPPPPLRHPRWGRRASSLPSASCSLRRSSSRTATSLLAYWTMAPTGLPRCLPPLAPGLQATTSGEMCLARVAAAARTPCSQHPCSLPAPPCKRSSRSSVPPAADASSGYSPPFLGTRTLAIGWTCGRFRRRAWRLARMGQRETCACVCARGLLMSEREALPPDLRLLS